MNLDTSVLPTRGAPQQGTPVTYRDIRDFLDVAEQAGHVRRVTTEVDHNWEPACLIKWLFQAIPPERRFGLLFDNVRGTDIRIATGCIGASPAVYALALQVEPGQVFDKWLDALRHPVDPVVVDESLCQENVLTGEAVDLDLLPVPTWTPGKDVGPYITTMTVTRNPETGAHNRGIYRTQVRDSRHVIANINPGRHGRRHVDMWHAQGAPAPIAWVIAPEPCVLAAAVANLPKDVDEMTVAGGLKGAPVPLVRCVTQDLFVPASAEIVIEGEVLLDEQADEGPFGEFAGYMGPVAPKPVVRITAITHRNHPIYYGITSQMPPSESTLLQSLANAPVLLKRLRYDLGEDCVRDLWIDMTYGGLLAHCVVSIETAAPGDGKRIGRLVAAIAPIKRITVVDHDVDIRDPVQLEWVLNAHYNPAADTVIVDDVFFPMSIDPSIDNGPGASGLGSKVIVDATQSIDAGAISIPPKATMMAALETWRAAGLPDFTIPRRLQFLLDRSG